MNALHSHNLKRRSLATFAGATCSVLCVCCLSGCSTPAFNDEYGVRGEFNSSNGVNAVSVFAQMAENAGCDVRSARRLSPKLFQNVDCVVWFPDRLAPPKQATRLWLERWLGEGSNRTLIYVGRDYDAEPSYWANVLPGAPKEQKPPILARIEKAKKTRSEARISYFAALNRRAKELAKNNSGTTSKEKASNKTESDANEEVKTSKESKSRRANDWGFEFILADDWDDEPWFTYKNKPAEKIRELQGDSKWLDRMNASECDIELTARMTPIGATPLISSKGDVILANQSLNGGRLFLVANGSFLLNAQLVNRENRKLADKLVKEIAASGAPNATTKKVLFLESDEFDPRVIRPEDENNEGDLFRIMLTWPLNVLFFHIGLVGFIYCLGRWPIFGLPKDEASGAPSDFGKHVVALSELLRRDGDASFAMQEYLSYKQQQEDERPQ